MNRYKTKRDNKPVDKPVAVTATKTVEQPPALPTLGINVAEKINVKDKPHG
jgi:hypothetical protein